MTKDLRLLNRSNKLEEKEDRKERHGIQEHRIFITLALCCRDKTNGHYSVFAGVAPERRTVHSRNRFVNPYGTFLDQVLHTYLLSCSVHKTDRKHEHQKVVLHVGRYILSTYIGTLGAATPHCRINPPYTFRILLAWERTCYMDCAGQEIGDHCIQNRVLPGGRYALMALKVHCRYRSVQVIRNLCNKRIGPSTMGRGYPGRVV